MDRPHLTHWGSSGAKSWRRVDLLSPLKLGQPSSLPSSSSAPASFRLRSVDSLILRAFGFGPELHPWLSGASSWQTAGHGASQSSKSHGQIPHDKYLSIDLYLIGSIAEIAFSGKSWIIQTLVSEVVLEEQKLKDRFSEWVLGFLALAL